MKKPDAKAIVSKNLSALMECRNVSNRQLADAIELAESTIWRIRRGDNAPSVVTLDAIAHFFEIDTFLLLLEGFDATNPASTRLMTAEEKQLLDALHRFTTKK